MCGFSFSSSYEHIPDINQDLVELISRRGPDCLNVVRCSKTCSLQCQNFAQSKKHLHYTAVASVLALRGPVVVAQPLRDIASGSLLLWNGEAWKFRDETVRGNDTEVILEALVKSCSTCFDKHRNDTEKGNHLIAAVKDVLEAVDGPFAFVFYEGFSQCVFYGRDVIGRRSLLVSNRRDDEFNISSVSTGPVSGVWREVDTGGVFMHKQESSTQEAQSLHMPWSEKVILQPLLNRSIDSSGDAFRYPSSESVSELEQQLLHALNIRLSPLQPQKMCGLCSDFAVLFSGGVDCTLLALLADTVMKDCEAIDLLNVAFENPRVVAAADRSPTGNGESQNPFSQCPDRKTALSSYHQLTQIRPKRRWRLILIDVPYVEASAHRTLVSNLIYPHNTEMDLSIALALYFASRGSGKVLETGQHLQCTTSARVLLSGLGADELFGGYSRHTRAFQKNSFEGLLDEIDLDFGRIGKRNLGRDDRVTAHWGREIRYPYLDETFARWVLKLPIWEKCGFGIEEDVRLGEQACEPGKLVLRLLAWKLGLERVACEKKRAIQFGSRTARMAVTRRKGHEQI